MRGVVFEGLAVERPDLFFGAFADAFVEALSALFAEPAAIHHLLHDVGDAVQFTRRIVGRGGVEIAQDVDPDIEADDIDEAEAGTLGQADQGAGEGIDLFDGVAAFLGELRDFGAEETADAIADEVGRVLAADDTLAEVEIAEGGDPIEDLGAGLGAGDDFRHMKVAGRIEEMGAEEMAAEFGFEAFGDLGEGDAAGIGGDDGAGRAQGGDAAPERAFDFEIFGDGFEDPLAASDAAEIVFEVAGGDEILGGLGEEADGPLFGGALDAGESSGVALRFIGEDDVEEIDRETGVGKVGCDARPHGPGTQNGNTA